MEEIELKDFINLFWRKKIIIVLVVLIFAIIGGIYTKVCVKPLYEATTSLVIVENEFENEAEVTAYYNLIDAYTVVVNSATVSNKVIENLKLDMDVKDLQDSMKIVTWATGQSMRITITNNDPELAAKITNEMAKVYMEEVKRIYGEDRIQIIDYAVANYAPVNNELSKNVGMFAFVGGALVCGYIFIRFVYSDTTKNFFEKENKKKQ